MYDQEASLLSRLLTQTGLLTPEGEPINLLQRVQSCPYCGLRHVAGFRRERIVVELYAKLISVVLTHFLITPLRMPRGVWANQEISPVKVRKIFRRFARDVNRYLGHLTLFQDALSEMLRHITRFDFKEKRKKEPNTCHTLVLVSAMCGLNMDLKQEASLA